MTISELIKRLEEIKSKHGDIPVFRYARDEHPEVRDVFLENHRETPQMFGHPKVVEIK